MSQRVQEHSTKPDAVLFLTRNGSPLARYTKEKVFCRLRIRAGVLCHDSGRYQPRLHDLRHRADSATACKESGKTCRVKNRWIVVLPRQVCARSKV